MKIENNKEILKRSLNFYKNKHKLTWEQVAQELKITRQGLRNIMVNRSPATELATCLRIEAITGLKPWEYLDGLQGIKKLFR